MEQKKLLYVLSFIVIMSFSQILSASAFEENSFNVEHKCYIEDQGLYNYEVHKQFFYTLNLLENIVDPYGKTITMQKIDKIKFLSSGYTYYNSNIYDDNHQLFTIKNGILYLDARSTNLEKIKTLSKQHGLEIEYVQRRVEYPKSMAAQIYGFDEDNVQYFTDTNLIALRNTTFDNIVEKCDDKINAQKKEKYRNDSIAVFVLILVGIIVIYLIDKLYKLFFRKDKSTKKSLNIVRSENLNQKENDISIKSGNSRNNTAINFIDGVISFIVGIFAFTIIKVIFSFLLIMFVKVGALSIEMYEKYSFIFVFVSIYFAVLAIRKLNTFKTKRTRVILRIIIVIIGLISGVLLGINNSLVYNQPLV